MNRSLPPQQQDEASCFENGQQSGREAAQQLAAEAPLSEQQRAWLSGFFAGLLSDARKNVRPTVIGIAEASNENPWPKPAAASRSEFASSAADGTSAPTPPVANAPPAPAHAVFQPAESTVQLRAALATSGKKPIVGADEPPTKYSADNPFAARIVQLAPNRGRHATVWRLTLDVEGSGLRCRPGDQLGVVPSNDPDLVRKLLRRLGAKGQENVTTARGTGPAWRALLEEFNVNHVTSELLWLLAASARNPQEATQLETLAAAKTPPEGSLSGVLRRFPSARPVLSEFVNCLSPLVPQYFPLASARSRHADSLEALVAKSDPEARSIVTQLEAEKLSAGDWLPIFVDSRPNGHPPAEIDAPTILLAPGAGAACAFAFLAERAATRGSGRNWLFTSPLPGEAAPAYSEQFAAWQTARVLTRLDVVPSNDLGQRFVEQAEMVQAWIVDGSYLFIYASAQECTELEAALAELLVSRARISTDEAYSRLGAMRATGQLRLLTTG